MSNIDEIERAALAELRDEQFRDAVKERKERLRAMIGRPWWKRILDNLWPYSIRLERKERTR